MNYIVDKKFSRTYIHCNKNLRDSASTSCFCSSLNGCSTLVLSTIGKPIGGAFGFPLLEVTLTEALLRFGLDSTSSVVNESCLIFKKKKKQL